MYRNKKCLKKHLLDRPGRKINTYSTLRKVTHVRELKSMLADNSTYIEDYSQNSLASYSTADPDDDSESSSNSDHIVLEEQIVNNGEKSMNMETTATEVFRPSFQQKLAEWAIDSNVCISHLTKLLRILNADGKYKSLPSDARTLLNTPRHTPVKLFDKGKYIYLGIKYFLDEYFKYNKIPGDTIYLSLSSDGTSLSTSGNNSLWLIFGCLHLDLNTRFVFDIAMYSGIGKPSSFNNFLSESVEELCYLVKNGYTSQSEKTYNVKIKNIVADAPALASLKYVKCHGGYSACTKCEIKGVYSTVSASVVYTELNAPLRTNEHFRKQTSNTKGDEHYLSTGPTILLKLPIDMISDFPLDKMHMVDEGVVKKILILLTTKVNRQKLPPKKTQKINERLENCSSFMPQEFQRRPRSLKYLLKMKAKEFRNFLLYTGPAVLKDIIPKATYNHFLTFSLAIRILSTPLIYEEYNDYAKKLLYVVVKLFPKIYGNHHMSYNVHSLLHLSDDAKRHGPLDTYSCYAFEAHIKSIKRMIRSHNMPLQQFSNRLKKNIQINLRKSCQNAIKLSGIEFLDSSEQNKYYKARISSFIIRTDKNGDNCVMLKDKTILQVQYFFKDKNGNPSNMIGRKFINVKPMNNEKCMLNFIMLTGDFEAQSTFHFTTKIVLKMCCLLII